MLIFIQKLLSPDKYKAENSDRKRMGNRHQLIECGRQRVQEQKHRKKWQKEKGKKEEN